MFRIARGGLAAVLVVAFAMIGVLAGSPAAQAATTGWVKAGVTLENRFGQDVFCTAAFRMSTLGSVTVIDEAPGGYCSVGSDTSPGWCQMGEIGCTDFEWIVQGTGCGTGVHLYPPLSEGGGFSIRLDLGAYQADANGCDPLEICAQISSDDGFDETFLECDPIALDPPGPDTSACVYGTYTGASSAADNPEHLMDSTNAWADWYQGRSVDLHSGATTGAWVHYVVYKNMGLSNSPSQTQATKTIHGLPSQAWNFLPLTSGSGWTAVHATSTLAVAATITTTPQQLWMPQSVLYQDDLADPDPEGLPVQGTQRPIVGAGAFYASSTSTAGYWDANTTGSLWRYPSSASVGHSGVLGVNQPERCAFYYGQKLFDMAGYTYDEPGGTVTEGTPPPTPDDPPVIDPPDDCDGLGCVASILWAIWGVLKGILSAIGGLAAAIAGAITGALSGLISAVLDGLEALFVPADGFEPYVADIKQAWKDSAPGAFILGFGDMGVTWPASGCSGIPVNFSMYSTNVNFNLGAACSGASATAAATVKLVASAGIVVAGGLACVRAIGSGFGWSPGIGRGRDT